AAVTLIDATDPTITAISPDVGAAGATQQDLYLNGTNFISTTQVRANGSLIADTNVVATTLLRVRLSEDELAVPGAYQFTVARQGGTDQACATPCQLTLTTRRPALVGTTPDSFSIASTADIAVNGGYYGTPSHPAVAVNFNGQVGGVDSANQMHVPSAG